MQAIRLPATVADQVKAQFTVAAFYAVVDFAHGDRYFTHHNFKMVNQGFHLGVNIFFVRQEIAGHIRVIQALRQIVERGLDDG